MYISDANHNPKPQQTQSQSLETQFSDDDGAGNHHHHHRHHHHDMIIEVVPTSSSGHGGPTRILGPASGPKKRAETWVQEETRSLISLRREMDSLFNTSKSNKHLWDQISARMRDRGFDRSPTMCTDKWRNLLKEFKKAKQQVNSNNGGGNGSAKMSYYKEIDEILRERNRCSSAPVTATNASMAAAYKSPTTASTPHVELNNNHDDNHHSAKVDSFLQFSDKGIDDASIPFGPMEANERPTLNLERSLDHEGHPLAITAADAVTEGGVPPSFWRDPGNGNEGHSYGGRVITIKLGDYTRRVGVDGTTDAIKDVIRSTFGIRTNRAFWLEDEEQVARSLDRDMPPGTYTLHLDTGMTIKLCHYGESDHISYPSQTISHAEEWTFYSQDEFRDFMHRRGWACLRELNVYRNIANLDDLRPDSLYRGVT